MTPPPPKFGAEVVLGAQRRLVVSLCWGFAAMMLCFALISDRSRGLFWTFYSLIAVAFFVALAFVATRSKRPRLASFLFCAVYLVMLTGGAAQLGLGMLTGAWSLCLVLIAAFLLSPAWALGSAVLIAMEVVVMIVLERNGFVPPEPLRMSSVAYAISLVMVLLVGVTISWLYERNQRQARERLVVAATELAASHSELERAHAELKAMHQRALTQERLTSLGMLAAGIAHEINNPMSFVTSNVNSLVAEFEPMLLSPELASEYREEVLPATLDGIRRVNAIVADLRAFARGDAGPFVEYSLDAQVEAAIRLVRQHFRGEVRLISALAAPQVALGRPNQIVQVVVNLLVNARHAIREEGTVTVRTWADPMNVYCAVQDDGCGIAADVQPRLFEPFFTTKPVGVGTGLGLAVVHGIVTGHDGAIDVDSTVGAGSRFTIRLPRQPCRGDAAGKPFGDGRHSAPTSEKGLTG